MKIKLGAYEGEWKFWDAVPFYAGAALHSGRNDPLYSSIGETPKPQRNKLSRYIDYWGLQAWNIPAMLFILHQCSK